MTVLLPLRGLKHYRRKDSDPCFSLTTRTSLVAAEAPYSMVRNKASNEKLPASSHAEIATMELGSIATLESPERESDQKRVL